MPKNANEIAQASQATLVQNKNTPILLLSDFPSYGTVALRMASAVLGKLHYDVFSLPTALVSNTLNYGKAEILDTTEYLFHSLSVWKELGFSFSALFIGFVLGETQAECIYQFAKKEKESGSYIFFDPIMADHGKLYNGLQKKDIESRKQLMQVADCIFPNKTEACLLADLNIVPDSCTLHEAKELVYSLVEKGAKSICITSMKIDEIPCIFLYEESTKEFHTLPYTERNLNLGGTGDLFSSLFIGKYLQEKNFLSAGEWALQKTNSILDAFQERNLGEKTIPIEEYLPLLD